MQKVLANKMCFYSFQTSLLSLHRRAAGVWCGSVCVHTSLLQVNDILFKRRWTESET